MNTFQVILFLFATYVTATLNSINVGNVRGTNICVSTVSKILSNPGITMRYTKGDARTRFLNTSLGCFLYPSFNGQTVDEIHTFSRQITLQHILKETKKYSINAKINVDFKDLDFEISWKTDDGKTDNFFKDENNAPTIAKLKAAIEGLQKSTLFDNMPKSITFILDHEFFNDLSNLIYGGKFGNTPIYVSTSDTSGSDISIRFTNQNKAIVRGKDYFFYLSPILITDKIMYENVFKTADARSNNTLNQLKFAISWANDGNNDNLFAKEENAPNIEKLKAAILGLSTLNTPVPRSITFVVNPSLYFFYSQFIANGSVAPNTAPQPSTSGSSTFLIQTIGNSNVFISTAPSEAKLTMRHTDVNARMRFERDGLIFHYDYDSVFKCLKVHEILTYQQEKILQHFVSALKNDLTKTKSITLQPAEHDLEISWRTKDDKTDNLFAIPGLAPTARMFYDAMRGLRQQKISDEDMPKSITFILDQNLFNEVSTQPAIMRQGVTSIYAMSVSKKAKYDARVTIDSQNNNASIVIDGDCAKNNDDERKDRNINYQSCSQVVEVLDRLLGEFHVHKPKEESEFSSKYLHQSIFGNGINSISFFSENWNFGSFKSLLQNVKKWSKDHPYYVKEIVFLVPDEMIRPFNDLVFSLSSIFPEGDRISNATICWAIVDDLFQISGDVLVTFEEKDNQTKLKMERMVPSKLGVSDPFEVELYDSTGFISRHLGEFDKLIIISLLVDDRSLVGQKSLGWPKIHEILKELRNLDRICEVVVLVDYSRDIPQGESEFSLKD